MATKKNTEAVAASAPVVVEEAAGAAPAAKRAELVARMACGLLQSPRFCSRITDAASQDLLVALAGVLADKILAATKDRRFLSLPFSAYVCILGKAGTRRPLAGVRCT